MTHNVGGDAVADLVEAIVVLHGVVDSAFSDLKIIFV
jgi:hypothetical protein